MRYFVLLLIGNSLAACAPSPVKSTSERPIRHEITSMAPRGCWGFDPYQRYPLPTRSSHPTFCLGEQVSDGLYIFQKHESVIVFSTTGMIPHLIEVGVDAEARVTSVRAGVRGEEIEDYIVRVSGLWGAPAVSVRPRKSGRECAAYTWSRESMVFSLDTCAEDSRFAVAGMVEFRSASPTGTETDS